MSDKYPRSSEHGQRCDVMDHGDSRIRILFLIDEIQSTRGGTEQHLYWLLRQLPDRDFEKHFAVLSTNGNCDIAAWPTPGIIVSAPHGRGPLNWWRRVLAVRQLIRQHRIDIVHAMCQTSELVAVLASELGSTARVIGSRRNIGYALTKLGALRSQVVGRYVCRYVANSEAAKLNSVSREKIPIGRFEVIPNPVVESRISEGRNNLGSRRDLAADDELIVAMVATIRPIKDYETFLRAAHIVADRRPKVRFVSIGEAGDSFAGLRDLATRLGLADKNCLVWRRRQSFHIASLCRCSCIVEFVREFFERGIRVRCSGLAVCSHGCWHLREIVLTNESGYVVPPASPEVLAEKILDLLDSPAHRRQFGAQSKSTRRPAVFGSKRAFEIHGTLSAYSEVDPKNWTA